MRVFVQVALCLALTFLTNFSPRLSAQPVTLHERQRISLPAAYPGGAFDVCLRGNDLLALALRNGREPLDAVWALVHLRKQADGEWQFVREVASVTVNGGEDFFGNPDVDCEGPLAAFSHPLAASFVVELTSAGWQATQLAGLDKGSHVDVYRGTVAIGGSWRSPTTVALVRKTAAGQWADVTYVVGNPGTRFNTHEITGPNSVWVAATEIGATGDEYEPAGRPDEIVSDLQIFDLMGGSWGLTSTLPRPVPGAVIKDRLALNLDEWTKPGDVGSYFVRDAAGAWTVKHSLLSDEHIFPREAVFTGQRAFAALPKRSGGEIVVFREEALRQYRHDATLSPSDLPFSFPFSRLFRFSVDGNQVAAAAQGVDIYLYNLPTTLPTTRRLEKSFENSSTAEWSFSGQTDWRIVSSGRSHVFRQLKTDGWARAVLTTFSGTDQSIEADVRIHELAATSAGAGFLLRYTNLQNYYYLLVHRNSLQVGKIVNGVFQQIATAPLSLVLGRTYRFRIEAIGSRVRAFVNNVQVAEVIDDAHARGMTGLTMFRARTDYDNVIVTSRPHTQLLTDTFTENFPERPRPWRSAPANAWSIVPYNSGTEHAYRQSLLTGTPRAVNGGPTGDQIVSAIVWPRAFNAGVANAYVGLIARHVDDNNHYYIALLRDRASLRKRVNGVHSTLAEIPFTTTPGTAYRLRLEAIGSSLRLYINGTLMVERQDATLPTGRYGLITSSASADFDNFLAVRP